MHYRWLAAAGVLVAAALAAAWALSLGKESRPRWVDTTAEDLADILEVKTWKVSLPGSVRPAEFVLELLSGGERIDDFRLPWQGRKPLPGAKVTVLVAARLPEADAEEGPGKISMYLGVERERGSSYAARPRFDVPLESLWYATYREDLDQRSIADEGVPLVIGDRESPQTMDLAENDLVLMFRIVPGDDDG